MSTLSSVQKAILVNSFPGPAALGERPIPQEVGDGEILVKILASEYPDLSLSVGRASCTKD